MTAATSVLRRDLGRLAPAERTREGFLRVQAHITRSGVFEYLNDDGSIRREYRPPEEVFDPASLASARGIPFTNNHPAEDVTASNARHYTVGSVGDTIVRDDDHVRAGVTVYDQSTVSDMETGKVEVSCGYRCEIYFEPGVAPDGTRYDCVQRNIRYNHLALVDAARAGATARIRMDAAERRTASVYGRLVVDTPPRVVQDESANPKGARRMPGKTDKDNKLTIEAAASEVAKAQQRADAADSALAAETSRADAAEGRVASLEEQLKALKGSRIDEKTVERKDAQITQLTAQVGELQKKLDAANDPKRLASLVKDRVYIEGASQMVLGQEKFSADSSDRELMVAVIERCQGVSIEAAKSDDYVRARFDAAIEGYEAGQAALSQLRDSTRAATLTEGARNDSKSARQQMIERNHNAWRKPSGDASQKV